MNESIRVEYLPSAARDVQISLLEEPWIGDEGALDAGFRRISGPEPLRPRGIAFDARATVVWDETGIQVLRPTEASPEVTAIESPVVLRRWFTGPPRLVRIDYLERGCLVGSRYVPLEEEAGHDAQP